MVSDGALKEESGDRREEEGGGVTAAIFLARISVVVCSAFALVTWFTRPYDSACHVSFFASPPARSPLELRARSLRPEWRKSPPPTPPPGHMRQQAEGEVSGTAGMLSNRPDIRQLWPVHSLRRSQGTSPGGSEKQTSIALVQTARSTASIKSEHAAKTFSVLPTVFCSIASSFKSCPLLKTFPACRKTATLTLRSLWNPWILFLSSDMRLKESAFLLALSLRVRKAIPSLTSLTTLSSPVLILLPSSPANFAHRLRSNMSGGKRGWEALGGGGSPGEEEAA
eukprot:768621-Hanusia_phi.AAC.1